LGIQLACDAARGRIVAVDSGGTTYEFDGTSWTAGVSGPGAIASTLTYDPSRGGVVAVAGIDSVTGAASGTIRVWNGTTWSVTSGAIRARTEPTVWYDTVGSSLDGADGLSASNAPILDVWGLSGATLVDVTPMMPAQAASLVYDSVRDRLLMFNDIGLVDAVWMFDGTWHPLATTVAAPAPYSALVFDPVRGGTLRFDGSATWIFQDDWQRLNIPAPNCTNVPVAMTYDYGARRAIMFCAGTQELLSDATAWTDLQTTNSLAGCSSAAYDLGTQHVVVLGNGVHDLVGNAWVDSSLSPIGAYEIVGGFSRGSLILTPQSATSQQVWERRRDSWTELSNTPVAISQTASSPTTVERSFGRLMSSTTAFGATVLLEHQFVSTLPDETCVPGEDADGDGLAGCDDPDCWWKCHPTCPYAASCP
jgi:hypothetical protein